MIIFIFFKLIIKANAFKSYSSTNISKYLQKKMFITCLIVINFILKIVAHIYSLKLYSRSTENARIIQAITRIYLIDFSKLATLRTFVYLCAR